MDRARGTADGHGRRAHAVVRSGERRVKRVNMPDISALLSSEAMRTSLDNGMTRSVNTLGDDPWSCVLITTSVWSKCACSTPRKAP